ncbi:MAG TPA: hypothetical protein GX520_03790 [Syntrophaceticus sp.]|nr:hypothetical protein [Syntrophaceticus sp.]
MAVQTISFQENDFKDMEKYKKAKEVQEIVDFIFEINKKKRPLYMAHLCNFARKSYNITNAKKFLVLENTSIGHSKKQKRLQLLINNLVEAARTKKYDETITVDDNLKRLRGSICELFIEKCLLCRYESEEVHCNSIVLFDGIQYTHSNKCSPSTLDNIGWNNSLHSGEFYECKTQAKKLVNEKPSKFYFLVSLRKELNNRGVNAVVAVASLDNEHICKKTLNRNHIVYIPFMKLLDVKSKRPA